MIPNLPSLPPSIGADLRRKRLNRPHRVLVGAPARGGEQPVASEGFTLVELLVVIAIIVVMMSLLGPAINSLKSANTMDMAATDIGGMLQLCRSYAITNNTYVYLGIGEFDSGKPEAATQVPATATVGGRVALFAIASKDGTRGYTPYATLIQNVSSDWSAKYNKGANFTVISKLRRYDNLHLFDYGQTPPTTGNLARPALSSYFRLGNSAADSVTPITYPLGSASPQYTFSKVVQFDPEGLLRVAPKAAPSGAPGSATYFSPQGVPPWLEMAFIQSHGNVVPNTANMFPSSASQNSGNHVCLQIDGIKGTVRTFRP